MSNEPKFTLAPEVETIARELIQSVPEHYDLELARIWYVFRATASSSNGRTVWGRARRVSGLQVFLLNEALVAHDPYAEAATDDLFVIEIARDVWRHLTFAQKTALVDHELMHCKVRETDTGLALSMRGHDLEEFAAVVRRHGLWASDVELMGAVIAEQLSFEVDVVVAVNADGEILPTEPPTGRPPDPGDPEAGDDVEDGPEGEVPALRFTAAQIAALQALAEHGRLVSGVRTDGDAGTVHGPTAEGLRDLGLIKREGFDEQLRARWSLTEEGRRVL